jgi:ribosomal protein S13
MLHNHGFTNLADLYKVPINELARIPTIGSSIAESIKKQLGIDVKTRTRIEEEHQIEDDADSVQTLLEDFGD